MTAKEMFENLGYEEILNLGFEDVDTNCIDYMKRDSEKREKQFITFDRKVKAVSLMKVIYNKAGLFERREIFETKDYKLFEAIQKQLDELGW